MIGIGGQELLVICALIGGVAGYFFRNKTAKNGKLIGVLLGVAGAVLTAFLLAQFIFGGLLLMPLYAILGAWFFNYLWGKISR